jgi:single-strand DNA-binding protein
MNGLRNSVRLIGHIGANPETKELEGGKKVSRFTLATDEIYKNAKGEKVKDTVWHNIVMWGKTASIAEKYLEKGAEIAIEGKLTNRSYTSKEGEKKYITEIIVGELLMLGKKN